MQISISIEPYLALEKTKLIQYIDNIVKISRQFGRGQVGLHFDYFKPNLEIFNLVQSYTNQIDIDLHLMQEPVPSVNGFRSVSFDITDFKNQNNRLTDNLSAVGELQRGLVLDLGCDIDQYKDLISKANFIMVMTVKCGKSGQKFQASALQLLPQVRRLNPNAIIIIDGGVNENNIQLLKNADVEVVVVGSYAKKCYENGNLAIGINRLLHN